MRQAGDQELVGFVENWERERCEQPMLGLPVTWIDDAGELAAQHEAVCALGTTKRRGFVEQAERTGFRFGRVIHPSATVSPGAELGPGCIVGPGVVVGVNTRVGAHTILNRGVLVGHDAEIGECVTVSPGANIAGAARVGDGAYVGMGSIVIDRVTVGAHSVVGAGAVVTRDVPERVQVVGVPARVVKEGVEGR